MLFTKHITQKGLSFIDKTELLSLERVMNEKEESILSWASRQQNTEKKIPITEATV